MLITCGLIIFSFLNLTLTGLFTAPGRFQVTTDGQFSWTCRKYAPGSAPNSWHGTVSTSLNCRCCHCHSNCTDSGFFSAGFPDFYFQAGNQCTSWTSSFFHVFRENFIKISSALVFQQLSRALIYCMISMVLTRMVSAFGAAAIAVQRVGGQIESVSWNTTRRFCLCLKCFYRTEFRCKKI